jgi:hypothetical protein
MWKAVLVGASVISIAGSSIVYAQQRDGEGERGQSPAFSQEDYTRSVDAPLASRLDSLKKRLRLAPEQEKNWPGYESALQALVKQRRERMEARQEQVSPSDPIQRMRQRAEALSGMGAALSRLADAEGPLYNSLDDGQKRQFATFSQMLGDQSDMQQRSRDREFNDDRGDWRSRDQDGDRRSWRGRDDDGPRRSWRSRDDDGDRRSWRGRDDDGDRRSWRGRDDDGDRHSWRGRDDDGDRRSWRSRDYDGDRRSWRSRDDDGDRRSWRSRDYDDDRRSWRGRDDDGDRYSWRGRDDDGDRPSRRGWHGEDRRGWRDRDDYARPGWRDRD